MATANEQAVRHADTDVAVWKMKFLARGHDLEFTARTDRGFPTGPKCMKCLRSFWGMWDEYAWGTSPDMELIPECKPLTKKEQKIAE